MQIKHQAVAQHIKRKTAPLYVLIGQDTYLLEQAFKEIKSALKSAYNCEEKVISVQSPADWASLTKEANSYSLFSEAVLLNVFYEKKTLDAAGKKVLSEYLLSVNPRCFIIIRAPNIPAKQIQWLSAHEQALVVIAYPLNAEAIKIWISSQLKIQDFQFSQDIPDLIHRYTQGNMLACAQVIEKMSLTHAAKSQITTEQVMEQLSNQCDHSLFELVDACLLGQADKAIQVLRHAAGNKTEPTLVLWMLTQEVRVLIQLLHLLQQNIDLSTAQAQLKIWSQKSALYQSSIKRFNSATLLSLLRYCLKIDEHIKSSLNTQVWNALECLAISIAKGQLIGDTCTV